MRTTKNIRRTAYPKNNMPRCHYSKNKKGNYKSKISFETEEEAIEYIEKNKLDEELSAYQCTVCNKWHIGHENKR